MITYEAVQKIDYRHVSTPHNFVRFCQMTPVSPSHSFTICVSCSLIYCSYEYKIQNGYNLLVEINGDQNKTKTNE